MINKEGFLSNDIDKYENGVESSYSDLIELYKSVNTLGQDAVFKIKIERSLIHQWCLAALFIRALSNYQAIYILAKRGMTAESRVLLRTLTEIQYIVIAIENKNELAIDYLGQEAIELRELFKKTKKWPNEIPSSISIQEIIDKLKELEKEIENHIIRKISVSNWAENAGMLANRETYYNFLCYASHANIIDIKKHFIYNDKGSLASFKWGPSIDDIPEVMLSTLQTMLKIIDSTSRSFKIDMTEEIKEKASGFNQVVHFYKNI